MTVREFNKKLDDQLDKISNAKFLLTCVTEVHSRQVKRIFDQGLNGNGVQIGQYSTKPMLAGKEQFVRETSFKQSFIDPVTGAVVDSKTEGDVPYWLTFKNRKTKTPNKKATAIMYLGDGYKEFRRIQGKQDKFVNLTYVGNLRFDFTNSLTLTGSVYQTGTKRKENSDKVGWMSTKYGDSTFKTMQAEKDLYNQCVKLKVFDTLNN